MKSLLKQIVIHHIVPYLTPKETLALSQVDKHTLSLFPIQVRKQLVRTIRCTMFEACFDDMVSDQYATILIAISNAIYDGTRTVVVHDIKATLFLYIVMYKLQQVCPLYNTAVMISANTMMIKIALSFVCTQDSVKNRPLCDVISTLDELDVIPRIDCVFIDTSVYIDPELVLEIEKRQEIQLLVKI